MHNIVIFTCFLIVFAFLYLLAWAVKRGGLNSSFAVKQNRLVIIFAGLAMMGSKSRSSSPCSMARSGESKQKFPIFLGGNSLYISKNILTIKNTCCAGSRSSWGKLAWRSSSSFISPLLTIVLCLCFAWPLPLGHNCTMKFLPRWSWWSSLRGQLLLERSSG